MKIEWMDEPEDHDYDAAEDYLSLVMAPEMARHLRMALESRKGSTTRTYKAKDVLRASGLPLLPADDTHVAKAMGKAHDGEKLSPILLVRARDRIVIADGYHRVCASYHFEDDTEIPCRIA